MTIQIHRPRETSAPTPALLSAAPLATSPLGAAAHPTPRRGTVASAPVDTVSMNDAVATILDWTRTHELHTAVGVNAALCNLATSDPRLRELVRAADLAYADGQSVVWAAHWLGLPVPERVATTDLVYPLVDACAAAGKRVFLFGGAAGVADAAASRLRERAPGLEIRCADGFAHGDDMRALVEDINAFGTDVLLVGLGDPLQHEWIDRWRAELDVPAVLTCGGLFDWTSGSRRRAPAVLQRAGLEWAWRLVLEPRRLARRYLLGNPAFLARVARQLLAGRRAPATT